MNRPRAADDFAAIRARMEELRREREATHDTGAELQSKKPLRPTQTGFWPQREITRLNDFPLGLRRHEPQRSDD